MLLLTLVSCPDSGPPHSARLPRVRPVYGNPPRARVGPRDVGYHSSSSAVSQPCVLHSESISCDCGSLSVFRVGYFWTQVLVRAIIHIYSYDCAREIIYEYSSHGPMGSLRRLRCGRRSSLRQHLRVLMSKPSRQRTTCEFCGVEGSRTYIFGDHVKGDKEGARPRGVSPASASVQGRALSDEQQRRIRVQ